MTAFKMLAQTPQYDSEDDLPLSVGATAVILGTSTALCGLIFLAGVAVGAWLF